MTESHFRVGLASPRVASSVADGVAQVCAFLCEGADAGADVVCFPESYIPGMRGQDFPVPDHDQSVLEAALEAVRAAARAHGVAAVIPMDWEVDGGLHNVAFVISADGEVLGYQTKNQLPLEEEPFFVPGRARRLFSIRGVPVGVVICHEGWRYPETVRWAAVRGAKIVFHPHYAGSDRAGPRLTQWGAPGNPYYEKAMVARAGENTIYFASVNYAMRYQEAATSLISPAGECLAHTPYGEAGLLVHDVDLSAATGLLASRFQPDRYRDAFDGEPVREATR